MPQQDSYAAPAIRASSATFATLLGGGLRAVLDAVIAANPAISAPTVAPTVAVTGGGSTGGNLPAGVYFVSYTWTDGAGETPAKESAASFTVSAGNIPRVTIPALPTGVGGTNIYLTAAGGASKSEVLYATGVATTTFDLSYAGPSDTNASKAPTTGNTGAPAMAARLHKAAVTGGLQLEWIRISDLVSHYVSGQPVGYQITRTTLNREDYVFAIYKQATREVMTLIAGQAQSLHNYSGPVQAYQARTFP